MDRSVRVLLDEACLSFPSFKRYLEEVVALAMVQLGSLKRKRQFPSFREFLLSEARCLRVEQCGDLVSENCRYRRLLSRAKF
jgi:hypothetical protein